tara:strand:+ start:189 stop:617 length:429 start_codon:yes stop_codon:yes gene_type:complete
MRLYEKKSYLKKKEFHDSQKNLEKIFKSNIQLIHRIFNTINISFLILIFILFFLSFDSQRKWSHIYKTLSKTKSMNNNLIEFISKIEEVYIGEIESLTSYRKTKPKDLIYLERTLEKKESFFKKNFRSFIKGFKDSKYQRGY